jgi:hypothetical protein
MNKPNLNNIEKEIEAKYQKKEKRKKTAMKVSGGSVKKLQEIIRKKV